MARSKASKHEMGVELGKKFQDATAAILAEYRGISSEELVQLRIEMRKVEAEFKVVKNRVAKKAIAISSQENEAISDKFTGPLGVAYIYGDVAAGAKALLQFAKDHQELKVTCGVMDGRALSAEDIKALSDLPSKEVLLAQIVGSLVAPHRGLLSVMNGVGTKLVRVISAIKDKKAS